MLSVRHSLQATSSLLRGSIRRPPLVAHKVKSPFPATLAPSSLALDLKFRFFSQQTSNTLRDDTIVFRKDITKPLPMDLAAALTKFGEVQQAGTLRLTKFEASTLVFTLAKHKRRECAELLRLCQEQNIRLQKFAHLSGFSLLCFFEQFDLALAEFERRPG
ncbi:uncharacterized protein IUM83_14148 [Phytophthora cinnamomi]|uniref:uncharacterized protein n=1 Tax=Phytophthora cinnamomi TaxID=4785 RepID=UPI0035597763|nr:hypothetical protein IUM83_14148 [Phytophthora cinnamomi]